MSTFPTTTERSEPTKVKVRVTPVQSDPIQVIARVTHEQREPIKVMARITQATAMEQTPKTFVSERAVLKRLNRALANDDKKVKTCRQSSRDFHNLGRHYVIDAKHNWLVERDIDLESRAREVGVLKPTEAIAETA